MMVTCLAKHINVIPRASQTSIFVDDCLTDEEKQVSMIKQPWKRKLISCRKLDSWQFVIDDLEHRRVSLLCHKSFVIDNK